MKFIISDYKVKKYSINTLRVTKQIQLTSRCRPLGGYSLIGPVRIVCAVNSNAINSTGLPRLGATSMHSN